MCYPVASAVVKTSTVAPTVGHAALGVVIRAGPLNSSSTSAGDQGKGATHLQDRSGDRLLAAASPGLAESLLPKSSRRSSKEEFAPRNIRDLSDLQIHVKWNYQIFYSDLIF
jgi:hypothetical protein